MTDNLRVAILGTARDIGKYIHDTSRYIEAIGSKFKDYRVIISESNSSDDTLSILSGWSNRNNKVHILPLGTLTSPSRTVRIATGRNASLKFMEDNYSDYDIMVMMDLDDVSQHGGGPDALAKSVLTCWDYDNWEVMTANQSDIYYDIWALRGLSCNYDCWMIVAMARMPREEAIRQFVSKHQVHIPEGDPIPVDAAFGGLGVYKMKYVLGSRYVGSQNICGNIMDICDNVPFHEQLRAKGARIFINTRMINK